MRGDIKELVDAANGGRACAYCLIIIQKIEAALKRHAVIRFLTLGLYAPNFNHRELDMWGEHRMCACSEEQNHSYKEAR